MNTEKKFGVVRRIGNKQVVSLRYTDQELFNRIVKLLHRKGYSPRIDYEITEYTGTKGIPTFRIEGIFLVNDILQFMAYTQYRTAELAEARGKRLEEVFEISSRNEPF